MKKHLIHFILTTFIFTTVFSLGFFTPVSVVKAQTMTVSQFVELLITIGAIAPDKIVAARAAVATLSQTIATTTPVVTTTTSDLIATSTSYIQVLTPNGGQSWSIDLDVPYTVTWGSSGLTQARVALVKGNNNVCNLHLNPVASKNGDHTFSVLLKTAQCYNLTTGTSTPLTDGTYKARVYYTDSAGRTVQDDGNATFKILPYPNPRVTVVYPNGGETLVRNTEYDVRYSLTDTTDSDDGLIYLYLLDNNGNTAYNSHKLIRSDRTYTLDLPSSLSAGAYKVKLKMTVDDVEIEDISNNFFWISTGL